MKYNRKKTPLAKGKVEYNRPWHPQLFRETNIEETLLINLSTTADTLLEMLGRITDINIDGRHIELRKVRKRRILSEKLQKISHEINNLFPTKES